MFLLIADEEDATLNDPTQLERPPGPLDTTNPTQAQITLHSLSGHLALTSSPTRSLVPPYSSSATLLVLAVPCLTFLDELKKHLIRDPQFIQLRRDISAQPADYLDYSIAQDLIMKGGRIWLPQGFQFIPTLLAEYHLTASSGRMDAAKMVAQLIENFTWQGLRKDVENFVKACVDCQHAKYETKRVVGLLCPLPVPHYPWEDLSLDFITGLPPFRGNTTILVVVDRFSKGIHLGMLPMSHSALTVVILFIDIVRKIHRMPRSLVSDRDPLFPSHFWQVLFRLSGTRLRMTSAYHP